jgi:hypothetical protein
VLARAPIRYAHNGDVAIAYTVFGDGPADVLFMGGFVSHLDIGFAATLGAQSSIESGSPQLSTIRFQYLRVRSSGMPSGLSSDRGRRAKVPYWTI